MAAVEKRNASQVKAAVERLSRKGILRVVAQRFRIWRKPFRLYLNKPLNGDITSPVCTVEGWFACTDKRAVSLRLNGLDLRWTHLDNPVVKLLFGRKHSDGFRAILDLHELPAAEAQSNQTLNLELVSGGMAVATTPLRIKAGAISETKLSHARRNRKREWLKTRVACPVCPSAESAFEFMDHSVRCRSCGTTFPDDGRVLNFLPGHFKREFRIDDAEDFSAHEYDEVASGLIEEVRRKRGKVLDCGSGLRSDVDEAVICLEVVALPTVDVLGVNQKLPFQDSVFDAVLSLNVLEHVTDPFACAAELVRVLKPGGSLYCCIPFLQPEHGYPHHYFNVTRSGLKQLFPAGLELINHFVPRSGEPVWALQWFLSWYAQQLPAAERSTFYNLRIQEIIDSPTDLLLEQSWVSQLSTEGKWKLASTTAAVFRKSVPQSTL